MGFWDEYKEIGGNWINADEKQVIIDNGIPLVVKGVVEDEANKYGPRYVVQVATPDSDDDRSIGFPIGTVDSRDRLLSQLADYLGRPDADEVVVKLEKEGRSILIRKA